MTEKIAFKGIVVRQAAGRLRLHYTGLRYLKALYREIGELSLIHI